MAIPLFQVDAFTDKPFAGNPAAVCLLPEARDEAWMQALAGEMNLSETAFLVARPDGFDLRWFTPTVEVDLCGHATLASAHTLWEQGVLAADLPAQFHSKSGLLSAQRSGAWIELDFPADPVEPVDPVPDILRSLGVQPRFFGRGQIGYLLELDSEAQVRGLTPDFGLLGAACATGMIVTAAAQTAPYDFVSRFFGPALGIDEDPVTGSAHCTLAAHWQKRLGKSEFLAYQASARGGVVRVRHAGDRVHLGGQAVTVLHGTLDV
jgi:PhzF family phenazine biosynthesis protein